MIKDFILSIFTGAFESVFFVTDGATEVHFHYQKKNMLNGFDFNTDTFGQCSPITVIGVLSQYLQMV